MESLYKSDASNWRNEFENQSMELQVISLVAERRLILARLFKAGGQSHCGFSRGSDG